MIDLLRKSASIQIRISDRGLVLSDVQLESLFDRYKQLDSGNDDRSNTTGVALAIVKAIIEAHGGTIQAELNERGERGENTEAEENKIAQLKKDFLAMIGHELRAPLESILLTTEEVLADKSSALPDAAKSHVSSVNDNVRRMLSFANDLLNAQNMESDSLK